MPTPREPDPATTIPEPKVDATLCLSTRTLAWLAPHPLALTVVTSVCDTLTELETAGHHPRLIAGLRFVLVHHAPTRALCCRACRRKGWRSLWRRRRFPCVVWHQIRGELLGHLNPSRTHRARPHSGTTKGEKTAS